MAMFSFLFKKQASRERLDLAATVLTPEETVRFDAALRGEDGWKPSARLLSAVERHNKAIAEGLIKAR